MARIENLTPCIHCVLPIHKYFKSRIQNEIFIIIYLLNHNLKMLLNQDNLCNCKHTNFDKTLQ